MIQVQPKIKSLRYKLKDLIEDGTITHGFIFSQDLVETLLDYSFSGRLEDKEKDQLILTALIESVKKENFFTTQQSLEFPSFRIKTIKESSIHLDSQNRTYLKNTKQGLQTLSSMPSDSLSDNDRKFKEHVINQTASLYQKEREVLMEKSKFEFYKQSNELS